MKTLGLLFSLFLLVISLSLLLFVNLLGLAFNWEDFLVYLILAAIIYLIIRLIGDSLDKKFNLSINQFLKGEKKDLFADKSLLRTFGLLLITFFPFLIYLQLFALFAAVTFALYGLMLVSNLERIPIGILIGLAVVAIGTGLAVLIGFFRLFFPKKRKTLGIEIKPEEQRKLWQLTNEIAKEIKAKPINKIVITPDPGIGVYLEGSIFRTIFGGGQRVLEIGLPSIHGLTFDEFKAILAHEYGHFSNADTQWSSFTFSMGNSLINTLQSTPGPSSSDKDGGWIRLMMSLNPGYWILFLFVALYFRVTNGFSRIREVMADIRAMNLYGGKAFSNGLLKVATNDTVFGEVIQKEWVPKLLKEEKTISNFSKFMEMVYKSVNESTVRELRNEMLNRSQVHNIYDSHPALKIRIDYATKFGQQEEKEKKPLVDVFENWDSLNEKVTELYNLRLLVYIQALAKTSQTQEAKTEVKEEKKT